VYFLDDMKINSTNTYKINEMQIYYTLFLDSNTISTYNEIFTYTKYIYIYIYIYILCDIVIYIDVRHGRFE